VVRFFGSGLYEDRVYLVLEFVEGKSLLQRMDRLNGLVPLEEIVRWIRDACAGVAEAHRQGVIHRDLKPSNLLITDGDAVKVIDFGVAKLRGYGVRTTSE
jgi:eukaryotic-like serine/threonine-protein kinase